MSQITTSRGDEFYIIIKHEALDNAKNNNCFLCEISCLGAFVAKINPAEQLQILKYKKKSCLTW